MIRDPLLLLGTLCAFVAIAEALARLPMLRHLGAALVVIVLTAVAANVGFVPTYGPDTAVYAGIFDHVAPLGIFWLLLAVDLRSLRRVGSRVLVMFAIGALGTVVGVLLAAAVVGGPTRLGVLHDAVAGMFVGTYVGGAVNFNAIAQEYHIVDDPALYAGAAAVDNAMTTLWMAATVALPRVLSVWLPRSVALPSDTPARLPVDDEVETTTVFDAAVLFALGFVAVEAANRAAAWCDTELALAIPSALVLTTIALVLAQVPWVQRLRGTRLLGLFAVYLFLAVIGALCDVDALVRAGDLAPTLGMFVVITVGMHGVITFGAARVLRIDAETAAVASQANIGGSTTALALARSLGRGDLELPAILIGALGTAVGNYLGFGTAAWLGS